MKRITDAFVCDPDCPRCLGTGYVCENHPDRVWWGVDEANGCDCGAGMPCKEENRLGLADDSYPQ